MTAAQALPATVVTGLVLGWSVAWPPGPVNAEMIRRGLGRGFSAALVVGLGACSADFLWALAVALGAGAVAGLPGVRPVLAGISVTLLLLLAGLFLVGAWRSWSRHRRGEPEPLPGALDSHRGGLLLGFGMALSSPWNLAFWLAVIGSRTGPASTLGSSLLLAASVVTGAALWCLALASALQWGARFATPAWEIGSRAVTGAVMLVFAGLLVARIAG